MRAFKFFLVLLILSLLAWGATSYWASTTSRDVVAEESGASPAPSDGSTATGDAKTVGSPAVRQASRLQDIANQLSIGSSIISALGAMLSAAFSFARYRQQQRLAAK